MRCLALTIPGPGVSGNHRNGRVGVRSYKSAPAKDYERRACVVIETAVREAKWTRVTWCALTFTLYNSAYDYDNFVKPCQDMLARGGAIEDDAYVVAAHTRKRWDDGAPRCDVSIQEVDPAAWGVPARLADASRSAAQRRLQRVATRVATPRKKDAPGLLHRVLALSRVRP